MMIDITNEIINSLKSSITGAYIYRSNPPVKPMFPCVIVKELSNSTHEDTIDSSGVKHNDIGFQIEIYTDGSNKISDALSIRNLADFLMEDTFGMTRDSSEEVPNYADTNVYRYIMRYSCIIDTNKTIYRG